MKKIAVVGAGQMGNGIAHVFAQTGFPVNLIDVKQEALDRALATISKNLDRQIAKGTLTEEAKAATLGNIALCTDMAAACSDRELIVEAATENIELKLKIFGQLDSFAPAHCVLATNTSSISITQIAAATQRPQQVIGMHFMNPVPVMKLIEVIRGYSTTDEVTNQVTELSKAIGKTVMKLGMAHPMGPLQLADFIGLDVCLAILNVLHEGFGNPKYAPCPLLVNMVMAKNLGVKSGKGFYDYSHGGKELVVAPNFIK